MPPDVTHARQHLVAALEADLIGPYEKPGGLDVSDELLKLVVTTYKDKQGSRGVDPASRCLPPLAAGRLGPRIRSGKVTENQGQRPS